MKNLSALILAASVLYPAYASATAPPQARAVLRQEQHWLQAIRHRDARTLAGILAPNFVHITYQGRVKYREQELASVKQPKPYTQRTSEQTVDFIGEGAIVHGINAISAQGKILLKLRYTDVYSKASGHWIAVSAQETAIR